MRVFLLRMLAAKNSRNRRAACSPASAIAAGTTSVLRKLDASSRQAQLPVVLWPALAQRG
jgi:hypothetical protein